jgi:hypothetical protein
MPCPFFFNLDQTFGRYGRIYYNKPLIIDPRGR